MPSQLALIARVGIVSLLVTGCVMSRGVSHPVHTYVLSPDTATESTSVSASKHEILLVSPPQAEPAYDTPRMAYLTRPHEVSYYADNQWAETPAQMFGILLLRSLEQSGLWRVVVPIPSSVHGDYRLDTQGLVLQQEFSQKPSQVRLAFRLQLVALHEEVVLGTRRFEVVESAPTDDAYGGVLAANRAVSILLEHIREWMVSCISNGATGRC
ncbi:MAG TPA: ABC-type transport auxiliary lipoprotein family protein [Nitrospiraceae bacterium]